MKKVLMILFCMLVPSHVYAATCSLSEVIEYQWGSVADTSSGKITMWRSLTEPKPSQSQINVATDLCTKEKKTRAKKILEVKTYGASLWQNDFPGVTFGTAKLVRESILSVIPASRGLTAPIQNLNDVWVAGAADVAVLNSYTGVGSISAHDPTSWWP